MTTVRTALEDSLLREVGAGAYVDEMGSWSLSLGVVRLPMFCVHVLDISWLFLDR